MSNYKKIKLLGEGAFAQVFLMVKCGDPDVQKDTFKQYAVKVIDKSKLIAKQEGISNTKQEIEVHRCLNKCESALQLFKVYETKNSIKMFLEY